MVSKASDNLPDPDRPVNTIILPRGRSNDRSLRLCSRAPRTTSRSVIWVRIPVWACGQGWSDFGVGRDVGGVAGQRGAAVHRVPCQHGFEFGDLVSEQRRLLELQPLG